MSLKQENNTLLASYASQVSDQIIRNFETAWQERINTNRILISKSGNYDNNTNTTPIQSGK